MRLPISSWAIKNPLIPFTIFVVFIVAGTKAYFELPVDYWPDVQVPIINVSITQPNANPENIEEQVTRQVETTLATISNVKHIDSIIANGISSTRVEFNSGTDLNQALDKVRNKIDGLLPFLPKTIEVPLIEHVNTEINPVLNILVNSSTRSVEQISWFIDNQVISALQKIKGVTKITRQGGQEREFQIKLDMEKLQAYSITVDMVNNQLSKNIQSFSSGNIDTQSQSIPITIKLSHQNLTFLKNIKIPINNNRFVRLEDLGEILDTVRSPRQIAMLNYQPAVSFAIYQSPNVSEVKIEQEINKALEKLSKNNLDIKFNKIQSQVERTKKSINAALSTFLEGALLAAIAVFFFLKSWRATLIAITVIPLSIIPTFLIMHWLGFTLNLVSMLALSLVSGVLVDDTIVEIENIMRHMRMGKTSFDAAIDAADEIGLAVMATTFVIIVVFLPVSFMSGIVGKYFIQFGITVAIATFFSFLVARLITPMLAAYFLKVNLSDLNEPSWNEQYSSILSKTLNKKMFILIAMVFLVIFTFALSYFIPSEFMPDEDKSESILQIELGPNSTLDDTKKSVIEITKTLLKQNEVKTIFSLIGGTDADTNIGNEVHKAILTIKLTPADQRTVSLKEFENRMQNILLRIPNLHISFLNENGNKPIMVGLTGDDPELLKRTTKTLIQEMTNLNELKHISSTIQLPRTEVALIPRNEDVARLGINLESISNEIRVATIGDFDENLIKLNVNNRQIPVRVLLNKIDRKSISSINRILVPTESGNLVPVSAFADVKLSTRENTITRHDYNRQVMIDADLNNATLGEAIYKINQLPIIKNLPSGILRYDAGDAESLSEMFGSFTNAMIAGLLLVYLTLVLLFRNFLQSATIMVALPLSILGALIALALTQKALSLPAIIGILMLMGIASKNGILLIDFIIELRKSGFSIRGAIVEGCLQRARPIMMTSFAMIAGMIPVLFNLGTGNGFRTPMAITLIGGLVSSTFLSLFFIPVVYEIVDDFERLIKIKLNIVSHTAK